MSQREPSRHVESLFRAAAQKVGWWLMGWPTGIRKPSRFLLLHGPYRWGARLSDWGNRG